MVSTDYHTIHSHTLAHATTHTHHTLCVAAEMNRADRVTVLLQERQEKDIRKINEVQNHKKNCKKLIKILISLQSVVQYRKECQRAVDRREFDLNDPESKQKDLPARVSDDDPRLTVSGTVIVYSCIVLFKHICVEISLLVKKSKCTVYVGLFVSKA